MHQGRPVIRIVGIDTMDDAEAMAGVELQGADRGTAANCPPATTTSTSCAAVASRRSREDVVGEVDRVEGPAGSSCLVAVGNGREVLIPLAEEICVIVDVRGRRIVVKPVEGLLDLNEPGGRRRRFVP